jgi:hypothetical protein
MSVVIILKRRSFRQGRTVYVGSFATLICSINPLIKILNPQFSNCSANSVYMNLHIIGNYSTSTN